MATPIAKPKPTSTAVVPFNQLDMEHAVAVLQVITPNSQNMSTLELEAVIRTGRSIHRNVEIRELHYLKGVGVVDAAVAIQADFDEDLTDKQDSATFTPDWNVAQDVRDQLGLVPGDLVVLMSCFLKSQAEQWRYNMAALRDAGAPWQDIKDAYGVTPPAAARMYGVVRQNEQTANAWAGMDAKYPRRTRCEKRGRIACVRAVNPVTVDQRIRKIEAAQDKAAANPEHYFQGTRDNKPTYMPAGKTTHDQRANALGRDAGDSLIDEANVIQGEATVVNHHPADEQQQHPAEETQAQPPEDAAPQDDPAINDPVPPTEEPVIEDGEEQSAENTSNNLAPELVDLKNRVDRAATGYANKTASPAFANFMSLMLREACGKNSEVMSTVCAYLTGVPRFADVPAPYIHALNSVLLKPREGKKINPKTNKPYSEPGEDAPKYCAAIFRAFNEAGQLF